MDQSAGLLDKKALLKQRLFMALALHSLVIITLC